MAVRVKNKTTPRRARTPRAAAPAELNQESFQKFIASVNSKLEEISDQLAKVPDLPTDFNPDDYLRTADLEDRLTDLTDTFDERITSESDGSAGVGRDHRNLRTSRRRRRAEALATAVLSAAIAINAPPEVEDAGSLGTTDDTPGPLRFALEDHTHSGVNLSDAQSIGGVKSLVDLLNLRTGLTSIPTATTETVADFAATFTMGSGAALETPVFKGLRLRPTITNRSDASTAHYIEIAGTVTQTDNDPGNFQLMSAVSSAIISSASTNGVFPWVADLLVDNNLFHQIGNGTPGAITGVTPANYIYVAINENPVLRASAGAVWTFTGSGSGVALYLAQGSLIANGASNSVLTVPFRAAFWDRGVTVTQADGGTVTLTRNSSFRISDYTAGTLQAGVLSELNHASGKWFLYGEGTARSSLVGAVRFGDNTTPATWQVENTQTYGAYMGNATISGVAQEVRGLDVNAAFTISGALGSFYLAELRGTVTDTGTGTVQGLRNTALVVRSSAGVNLSTVTILDNRPTLRSNALAITGGTEICLNHAPAYDIVSGGTIAGVVDDTVRAALAVGASTTVATRRGLNFLAHTGAGAVTNTVAVDVAAVTGATLAAALRSAIAATTGAWCILSTGTADSSFAGRIFVGGAASTVPVTDLDVDGDLAIRSANVTLANGTNDDVAIGARSFVRITGPTGNFTTTSFANPFNGKILVVVNTTAQQWTIVDDAGTGTAANRIYTGDGANVVLAAGADTTETGRAMFIYDATFARWMLIAARDTAGPR